MLVLLSGRENPKAKTIHTGTEWRGLAEQITGEAKLRLTKMIPWSQVPLFQKPGSPMIFHLSKKKNSNDHPPYTSVL
ncbi:hypothetical protein SKAU_G00037880 [Synaphobranchus kaupii]|uniref:Uncharacterized protein n=1 Tax=Synaphobranchus kaupii TaxID=118154 RepID=A0A9Q1JG76_SYNKA|nr:hypothetical protein SKAU_G00037880 [Synaphobranchus kaupii]